MKRKITYVNEPIDVKVNLAYVVPWLSDELEMLSKEIKRRKIVAERNGDMSRSDLHKRALWHLENAIDEFAKMRGEYE